MHQDRIWYLFKETTYYIDNEDYVAGQTSFYLYNNISKFTYKDSSSLIEAIGTTACFNDRNLFVNLILKGQVPLFDTYVDSKYHDFYVKHEISAALPLVEMKSTFIDKAVSYRSYAYYQANFPHLTEKYLSALQRFKEQKQNNKSPLKLKKGDKELIDKGNNVFVDVTLLSCSKERPTINEVKRVWPELLV